MISLKLNQFVEKALCDKYVVELSLGDLPKVQTLAKNENLRYKKH